MNGKADSLLFRGNGVGFRFGADYFLGKVGIGFSSGFGSSSPDDATINNFIKNSPFPPDGLIVNKARQQNMYMLLGPSVRFGNTVELYAHAKGGLFINNSGLISIQQKGAQRALYRNESTSKSIYPGFLTGLGMQYKTRSDIWSFGIGVDYMSTRSEVNNYDARRGGGIEALKLSHGIRDLVTGITVRYNISSPRDHGSGQASGKRNAGNINQGNAKTGRDASSGLATGKRTYQPGQPVYGNITRQEPPNESCGTVTQTITNSDGTTEEIVFACPADAASYNNRLSMNVTVPKQTQGATFGEKVNAGMHAAGSAVQQKLTTPKQTQGATFGEKVNAGLHAAGSAVSQGTSLKQGIVHRDLAARNIISGRLSWISGTTTGIVTNKSITESSVNRLAGGGSGAAAASYAATGMVINNTPGLVTTLYAREAGSGMATGKRSREKGSGMASGRRSREKGSGMATGRRQYEPVFVDGQGSICDPCIATAKLSGVKSNPLYEDKGTSGNNPMHESKLAAGGDDDCDGIEGMTVSLTDPQTGAVIAKTITENCGDFFFANVPDGDFTVKITGTVSKKRGYDYYAAKSATDLMGKVELGDQSMQLLINTDGGNNEMQQKAGISTSRSNIRNKTVTIIEADVDGDGNYESLQATGTFSDGSSQDISSATRRTLSNTPGPKGIVLEGNALNMRRRVEVLKSNKQGDPNANRITSIAVLRNGSRLTATGTFSDGSTRDVTENLEVNTNHPGVKQYTITIADLDDDGTADAIFKTKTKSNQSNDRMAPGDLDAEKGLINAKTKISKSRSNIQNNRTINDEESNDIWSPRSNIKILRVAAGDVDGDGKAESLVGGSLPGGAVISAFALPGDPIPGLDVKLGKNPGGQSLQSTTSNANGEFEFTKIEAGDYTLIVEQKIFVEDETLVSLGRNNTRAQDHNSSRSNKTGSIITDDQDNEEDSDNVERKGWDGTVKGGSKTKAQDHNSSRSNKSGIVADNQGNEEGNDEVERKGWDGTVKGGSKAKAQDHNSSRSNKSGIVADNPDNEGDNGDVERKGWDGTGKGVNTTKAQDHNSSRSNKSGIVADDQDNEGDNENVERKGWDGTVKGGSTTKAQDHNSVRSNKSSSVIDDDAGNGDGENKKSNTGPVKWMAPESLKRTVNTSRSSIKNIIATLDDLEDQLNADASTEEKLVNTSRSNIKDQRMTANELQETLSTMEYMDKETALHEVSRKMTAMNSRFEILHQSITALGGKYSGISNVLKSRHDIAMNSIRNMK